MMKKHFSLIALMMIIMLLIPTCVKADVIHGVLSVKNEVVYREGQYIISISTIIEDDVSTYATTGSKTVSKVYKIENIFGSVVATYTLKGKLLGHISIIQTDIVEAGKKHNVDSEVVTLLQHMVLSHHGKLEYGSPVLPLILEAEVMYLIDNMDSKIVMINKALKDVEVGGNSIRVMGLDGRSFYKHSKSNN